MIETGANRVIIILAVALAALAAALYWKPWAAYRQARSDAAAAAQIAADRERMIVATRAAVARILRDPESARFSDSLRASDATLRDGTKLRIVCGSVNAKNAFGGYTGAQPFYLVVYPDGSSRACVDAPEKCFYLPGEADRAAACLTSPVVIR